MDDVASFITNITADAYGTCLCIASKKVITDMQQTNQSSTSAIDDDGDDELNIPVTTNNEDAASMTKGCWNNQYKWNGDDIPTTSTPKDIADHQNVDNGDDNGIVCVNSFQGLLRLSSVFELGAAPKVRVFSRVQPADCGCDGLCERIHGSRTSRERDIVHDQNEKRPKPARLVCSTASEPLICTLLQKDPQ